MTTKKLMILSLFSGPTNFQVSKFFGEGERYPLRGTLRVVKKVARIYGTVSCIKLRKISGFMLLQYLRLMIVSEEILLLVTSMSLKTLHRAKNSQRAQV